VPRLRISRITRPAMLKSRPFAAIGARWLRAGSRCRRSAVHRRGPGWFFWISRPLAGRLASPACPAPDPYRRFPPPTSLS